MSSSSHASWLGLLSWTDFVERREDVQPMERVHSRVLTFTYVFLLRLNQFQSIALNAFLESPSLLYKLAMALTVLREGVFCIVVLYCSVYSVLLLLFPSQLLQPLLPPSIPKLP